MNDDSTNRSELYIRRLVELFIGMFDWKNFPNNVDPLSIEKYSILERLYPLLESLDSE